MVFLWAQMLYLEDSKMKQIYESEKTHMLNLNSVLLLISVHFWLLDGCRRVEGFYQHSRIFDIFQWFICSRAIVLSSSSCCLQNFTYSAKYDLFSIIFILASVEFIYKPTILKVYLHFEERKLCLTHLKRRNLTKMICDVFP